MGALPVDTYGHVSEFKDANGNAAAVALDANGNAPVNLGTKLAGEDLTNDLMKTEVRASYTQLSASTPVKSAAGRLYGIFVSAASATPTITVYDNTTASGTKIIDTFTPTAGQMINFGVAIQAGTGIYVAVSGTVSCTVFWN